MLNQPYNTLEIERIDNTPIVTRNDRIAEISKIVPESLKAYWRRRQLVKREDDFGLRKGYILLSNPVARAHSEVLNEREIEYVAKKMFYDDFVKENRLASRNVCSYAN